MSSAVVIDELPDNFYLFLYSGQDVTMNAGHMMELLRSVFEHGLRCGAQFEPHEQPELDLHLPDMTMIGPGNFIQLFSGPCRLALEFPEAEQAVLYRLRLDD